MALENLEKKYNEGVERMKALDLMKPSEIIDMLLNDITIRSNKNFQYIKELLEDKPHFYKTHRNDGDEFILTEITIVVWHSLKIDARGVSFKFEHGNHEYILDYYA